MALLITPTSLLFLAIGLACLIVGYIVGRLWDSIREGEKAFGGAGTLRQDEIKKLSKQLASKTVEAADWKRAHDSMVDAYESMKQAAKSYEEASESHRQAYEDMKSANESLRSVIEQQH